MKPCVHKTLTAIAIKICDDKLNLTKENKLAIIQGTEDEDKTPIKERIQNWHFFRGDNTRIPKNIWCLFFIKCKPTSKDIFNQRIKDINCSVKKSNEYYKNLGRILHHIQDMSTPSHVVPIYHAIFIKDYFEQYMKENIKQYIKENIDSLYLKKTIVFTNNIDNLEKHYTKSAKATLKYIEETTFKAIKNNDTVTLPLSKFWLNHNQQESKKYKGFGTYGNLHKLFKNDKVRYGYKRIDSELKEINKSICNKAIQDTCDVLLYKCKTTNNFY